MVTLKVRDYRVRGRRADIHLQEKGGVVNRVAVHHKVREYLDEYIEAAKLAKAPESWLWRSMPGRKDDLSERPMSRHDALQVVRRRCATANLPVDICCHSFRGSGITLYLQKGGNLEHAQKIAGHADPRTTEPVRWSRWTKWSGSSSEGQALGGFRRGYVKNGFLIPQMPRNMEEGRRPENEPLQRRLRSDNPSVPRVALYTTVPLLD